MKLTDLKTQYNGEIVLLTKDQCAQCDHMKRRLNRMGETYTEINLEKDPELLADVKAQGARTAPVMLTPRGQLLTTNVVDMENQLKEELKQPRNHHLYTPQEAFNAAWQNPEWDVPTFDERWEQASIDYEIPSLETPREINISFQQWAPAAEEITLAWMDQSNFEQASLYKWADFTTYLENTDTETALDTLQNFFPYIDETKLESLKELTHPKAQSDLATAAKGAEVIHSQHPAHNVNAHHASTAHTPAQMPPAPAPAQQKHTL